MRTKRLARVATAIALSAMMSMGVANAAPGDNDKGYGGCVDNFYGNATNERPDGHGVLPSLSPGPHTMSGNFISMGDVMQAVTGAGFTGKDAQPLVCSFQ